MCLYVFYGSVYWQLSSTEHTNYQVITKYYPPTKNGGGLWSDDSLFQVRDGEKYLPDNKKMF